MSELHQPTIALDGVLRPTHVEVDLAQVVANHRAIAAHVTADGATRAVMPILKANAYGHGLTPVAKALADAGAPYLGVAYLEEGLMLREAGITTPILVLGGIIGSQIPAFLAHDLTLCASSVDKLRAIDEAATAAGVQAKVHLKIDTGMERIGVHWYSAEPLLEASLKCKNVQVEGIFSHLATADEADPTYTRLQIERFAEVCDFYPRRGVPSPIRHLANSAGVAQHPDTWLDLVRPGILSFGIYPSTDIPQIIQVKPALSWVSRVVYFKVVNAGNPVSYGRTWAPDDMTRVVTVPVGYGDGYFRSMSGKASVGIRGQRYPVVGRICMDQVVVDIGWNEAFNGDRVVLLGSGGPSVEELARWAGTIPYEVLTNINTRVPRIYSSDPHHT